MIETVFVTTRYAVNSGQWFVDASRGRGPRVNDLRQSAERCATRAEAKLVALEVRTELCVELPACTVIRGLDGGQ